MVTEAPSHRQAVSNTSHWPIAAELSFFEVNPAVSLSLSLSLRDSVLWQIQVLDRLGLNNNSSNSSNNYNKKYKLLHGGSFHGYILNINRERA